MRSGGKHKVKLIEIDGVCVYPCLHAWVFLLKQTGKLIKYTWKVTGKKFNLYIYGLPNWMFSNDDNWGEERKYIGK